MEQELRLNQISSAPIHKERRNQMKKEKPDMLKYQLSKSEIPCHDINSLDDRDSGMLNVLIANDEALCLEMMSLMFESS